MERLKEWLEAEEMSQADFGHELGVSQPTVSEWLSGESTPSVNMLKRISKRTHISIDELLGHQVPRSTTRSAARA